MVGNYINMIVNNTLIKNEKVEELFNNLSNQEFQIIEAAHLATHNNNSDEEDTYGDGIHDGCENGGDDDGP